LQMTPPEAVKHAFRPPLQVGEHAVNRNRAIGTACLISAR
jgi:hypothetical protein